VPPVTRIFSFTADCPFPGETQPHYAVAKRVICFWWTTGDQFRLYTLYDRDTADDLSAKELVSIRRSLKLSRAVFARYLRANERTPENWEQGRAKPNAQAALLIRLVARYPDTLKRLAAV